MTLILPGRRGNIRAMRILVVEDDPILARCLLQALDRAGHAAEAVGSAEAATERQRGAAFDMVLLDVGLPGMDGFELLRRMRGRGEQMPVMLITARDALNERVHGLDLGADDYLTKPFAIEELLARVAAIGRRAQNPLPMRREFGPLVLDDLAHRAWLDGQALELPAREWAVLGVLVDAAERVVSKEQISSAVCTWGEELSPNAVELYVSRLRSRLDAGGLSIRAVRGIGYMLQAASRG
jgi:DNA-binding response OmpR family regulator